MWLKYFRFIARIGYILCTFLVIYLDNLENLKPPKPGEVKSPAELMESPNNCPLKFYIILGFSHIVFQNYLQISQCHEVNY